jgi:aspartyl-tRNA(Asn)/glutamyl-tRNA(Gln) amidotransferase subunit B
VVQGGTVPFMHDGELRTLRLTRAHLEEDAGKSVHEGHANMSGIDLNRAGTPLLEIVTEPDMRSSSEAVDYAKALHALVQWLDICDGNMQEGSFRCDANVSVRRPGQPFGTRREIKNLNSFRHLQQAIDYEINWQISELEDGRPIVQATVLFDPDSGETRMMRTKEDAQDYRYFPDPDLPPLVISREWVEQVRGRMPELPGAMAERFQKADGLAPADAALMTQSLATARFYEAARDAGAPAKLVANWVMGEISRRLNADAIDIVESPVDAALLAALIGRIQDGTISNNAARQVFDALWTREKGTAGNVDALIASLGLKQMNDGTELESIVDGVLAANQKSVDEFRAGKDKAFQALVGQAMKASKGKANPAQVNEMLKKKLGV